MTTARHPLCAVCGWRKGGVDSWDGHACKCGLSAPPQIPCGACLGTGLIESIAAVPRLRTCIACGGSGLRP